ncbi:MAG: HlyC/CorC family transporter [Francisellaceae bacterium]|nr:HlyC/CorC family transporter [Francisellaceae bacterium]
MSFNSSVPLLGLTVLGLFLLCVFFAASETSLMSLNRYRLKHSAKTNHFAKRILLLLAAPERLLGAILIGNTFALMYLGSIGNQIGREFLGEWADIAPALLGTFTLIFAEIIPKTIAAHYPEKVAYPLSWILQIVLWILYPLVGLTSVIAKGFLKIIKISGPHHLTDSLNREELRTVLNEASHLIPRHHQAMLIGILDLEKMRVDHIMIPRNEVKGINLADEENSLLSQLSKTQHTLLPVYRNDLHNVEGILHTRDIIELISNNTLTEKALLAVIDEPYFVPQGTSLHVQLRYFQQKKRRMGLVVDEYGDVLGLVTLEDILEEIVGEFTTDEDSDSTPDIFPQEDGSFLIDGSISIRDLNRSQGFELPIEGPTTLSGLIIEHLEAIPNPGTSLKISDYAIEIIEVKDNTVKIARVTPWTSPPNELE